MKKKEEVKYFDTEWGDMQTCLKLYMRKEVQEDLHCFRVQVKKILAFLILADSAEDHPKFTKAFKPVKKVFKEAGDIRTAYINLELIKTYQTTDGTLVNSQQHLMEQAAKKFRSNKIKHLEKIKVVHKTLVKEIKPLGNMPVNLFYRQYLEQISDSLADVKFTDELHQCRKLIKNLMYNNKLVHPLLNTGFNEDYADQVQKAIGEWHDNVMATALFLNSEIKDEPAISGLKKEHTKLKNNIINLVKDFYTRATMVVELPFEQLG